MIAMSNLIDAASVNPQTAAIEICFDGPLCSASESVAGTYSVSGLNITFTPLSPYPAGTVIAVEVNGLLDEAGNACPDDSSFYGRQYGGLDCSNGRRSRLPTAQPTWD